MINDLTNIGILATAFLLLFASGEYLYRFRNVKGELTRKWIHFGTGLLTLLFPLLLTSHWSVLVLCSAFAGILLVSLRLDFLPSINAIQRVSYGSLCYPLAVYIVFWLYEHQTVQGSHYSRMLTGFYMPVLILAVSDPLAALSGKQFGWKPYSIGSTQKTAAGSLAFFLSAFLIALVMVSSAAVGLHPTQWILPVLAVALAATLAEAISGKGWDNLTVPLIVVLTWYVLLSRIQ